MNTAFITNGIGSSVYQLICWFNLATGISKNTQFASGASTITMQTNPLHERNYSSEKTFSIGYDSSSNAYAYDDGTPIFYNENLVFPFESLSTILSLLVLFEQTTLGSKNLFSWNDRGTIKLARYKGLSYTNVARDDYQVTLSIEVQR
jgi:beta-lactamase class A